MKFMEEEGGEFLYFVLWPTCTSVLVVLLVSVAIVAGSCCGLPLVRYSRLQCSTSVVPTADAWPEACVNPGGLPNARGSSYSYRAGPICLRPIYI